MILTDADELRAALRLALEERDEARAELMSTAQQLELEREASAQLRAELGERMRETAEAQREACARRVEALVSGPKSAPYFVPLGRFMAMGQAAEVARSAALVTDTKADGGAP